MSATKSVNSIGETPDAVVPDAAHRHGSGVTSRGGEAVGGRDEGGIETNKNYHGTERLRRTED